jgi:hypothetical protein
MQKSSSLPWGEVADIKKRGLLGGIPCEVFPNCGPSGQKSRSKTRSSKTRGAVSIFSKLLKRAAASRDKFSKASTCNDLQEANSTREFRTSMTSISGYDLKNNQFQDANVPKELPKMQSPRTPLTQGRLYATSAESPSPMTPPDNCLREVTYSCAHQYPLHHWCLQLKGSPP